jgi:hypothetical protein
VIGKRLVRRPEGSGVFHWQTEQPPDQGRSGGGLFDRAGRLVGVCVANQEGRGYYLQLDEVHAALRRQGLSNGK